MYQRSEIRHACYRAKNGSVMENNKEILARVEPLLEIHQNWKNFGEVWDVIVTKSSDIKIVYPETNHDFIHRTLLKAQLYSELGKPFTDLDDRAYSLTQQVEQLMLNDIMTWENYNTVWGVAINGEINSIKTVLYNSKPSQIEVTDDMIEASKKEADGSAFSEQKPNILQLQQMNETQTKAFEDFIARKYKG